MIHFLYLIFVKKSSLVAHSLLRSTQSQKSGLGWVTSLLEEGTLHLCRAGVLLTLGSMQGEDAATHKQAGCRQFIWAQEPDPLY